MFAALVSIFLLLRRVVHTGDSVQAPGVANVGQTLGHDFDKEILAVAHVHVAFGMGGELGLTPALGRQETEGYHLPLG